MDRRRTSAGFRVGSIYSNFCHIRRLRRKIRDLKIKARELRQRWAMIMVDFNANVSANNDLKHCIQQIEDQMQLQDMLNGSVEEEIRTLRQMIIQQDQQAITEFSKSVAYTSHKEANQDVELEQNQDVNVMQDHHKHEDGIEGLNSHYLNLNTSP